MKSVALIHQPLLAEARRLADECGKVVSAGGYTPRVLSAFDLTPAIDRAGVRLAVTFGGDGTVIRAARWLAGSGVPILAVAMGKLGFLTEVSPQSACASLPSVLAGEFWVDERLMISASIQPSPEAVPGSRSAAVRSLAADGSPLIALNDVVVGRGSSPKVVQAEVVIDGARVVRYVADAVVVATPTGSTAYSLAAGGPVMAPGVQGLAIVPVAAHLAALRSLVVPVSTVIELRATADQPPLLVLDGQVQIPLRNDQPVTVQLAGERTIFARTGSHTRFYETLMESFKKR